MTERQEIKLTVGTDDFCLRELFNSINLIRDLIEFRRKLDVEAHQSMSTAAHLLDNRICILCFRGSKTFLTVCADTKFLK